MNDIYDIFEKNVLISIITKGYEKIYIIREKLLLFSPFFQIKIYISKIWNVINKSFNTKIQFKLPKQFNYNDNDDNNDNISIANIFNNYFTNLPKLLLADMSSP